MASERKDDLLNMKLLTSKETGRNYHSNKYNKTINEFEVVLQSVDNAGDVRTGIMGDEPPVPENGTVLEKVLVFEDNFKGKITQKFLQPTAQSSGDGGGGGNTAPGGKSSWTGGRQEDVELKLTSFAFSYAKDLFASTPEASIQGLIETANTLVDEMQRTYKRLKA